MRLTIARQPTRSGRRFVVAEVPAPVLDVLVVLSRLWGVTRSEALDALLRRDASSTRALAPGDP
ncbi:MAG: hypothetical protein ACLQCU_12245 [Acidimicrobiales bacterium]